MDAQNDQCLSIKTSVGAKAEGWTNTVEAMRGTNLNESELHWTTVS